VVVSARLAATIRGMPEQSPHAAPQTVSSRELAEGDRPLPPAVVAAGWVSLLTDVATEMVYPLLPAFIETTLGGGKAALGLIEGVAETTAAVVRLPAGWLSDRFRRRKPLMLVGYGLAGLVRPLLAIVTVPWQALVVRFADRVGKGLRGAPRDALIADVTSAHERGRAFGFHRAMDHAGAAIGPLIAFAFLWLWPGEYRWLFGATLIPGLIVIAVLYFGVREPERNTQSEAASGASHGLATQALRGPFVWLLAAILLFTLGRATELLVLSRVTDLGFPVLYVPLLWCVYNLAKSRLSLWGGRLGDRYDPRWPLLAGWATHVVVYVGFSFAVDQWQALTLFMVYALHWGLSEPAEKILVARWSGSDKRGTTFGWYHLAVGAAALPASAVFGWLWTESGTPVVPFIVASALGAMAMAVVGGTFLRKTSHNGENQPP
jgi:MFS family permease